MRLNEVLNIVEEKKAEIKEENTSSENKELPQ